MPSKDTSMKSLSEINDEVTILIEKDEYGYCAYVPELEGCQSQGDTLEEAKANIQEAIDLYIEVLALDDPRESAQSVSSAFHS